VEEIDSVGLLGAVGSPEARFSGKCEHLGRKAPKTLRSRAGEATVMGPHRLTIYLRI